MDTHTKRFRMHIEDHVVHAYTYSDVKHLHRILDSKTDAMLSPSDETKLRSPVCIRMQKDLARKLKNMCSPCQSLVDYETLQ